MTAAVIVDLHGSEFGSELAASSKASRISGFFQKGKKTVVPDFNGQWICVSTWGLDAAWWRWFFWDFWGFLGGFLGRMALESEKSDTGSPPAIFRKSMGWKRCNHDKNVDHEKSSNAWMHAVVASSIDHIY